VKVSVTAKGVETTGFASEGLRDGKGLREEALQKRDDVLQLLVVRDRLEYLLGNAVMVLADDGWVQPDR
jgi:hypothetical protein